MTSPDVPMPSQGSEDATAQMAWYAEQEDASDRVRAELAAKIDTEQARDIVGAVLRGGSNVTVTVDDAGNTVTISAAGGTGGTGAVSSVNGETGTVVLDAADVGAQPAGSYAAASHTHTAAQVGAVQAVTTGAKLWIGTQAAYNAISSKDANTVYMVAG